MVSNGETEEKGGKLNSNTERKDSNFSFFSAHFIFSWYLEKANVGLVWVLFLLIVYSSISGVICQRKNAIVRFRNLLTGTFRYPEFSRQGSGAGCERRNPQSGD